MPSHHLVSEPLSARERKFDIGCSLADLHANIRQSACQHAGVLLWPPRAQRAAHKCDWRSPGASLHMCSAHTLMHVMLKASGPVLQGTTSTPLNGEQAAFQGVLRPLQSFQCAGLDHVTAARDSAILALQYCPGVMRCAGALRLQVYVGPLHCHPCRRRSVKC